MRKLFLYLIGLVFCFISIFVSISPSSAKVYFLEKSTSVQAQKNERPCPADGYKVTEAECMKQGLTLMETCPADSRYGKSCSCDQAQFQYTTDNCAAPKSPTGETCNGKYKTCDCASNVYKYYTNTDCPTNKIVDTQTACTYANTKVGYSACVCPSKYSQTCTGGLEGVGEACDGKYQSCKCASNYFSCDNGGATGASSCTDSSGTKYTSCKVLTCESGGYLSTIPSGQTCTSVSYNGLSCYKDCSEKKCTMSVGQQYLPNYYVENVNEAQGKFSLGVIFFPDSDFPQNIDCIGYVTSEQFKRYVKDNPSIVDTMETTTSCSTAKIIEPKGTAYEVDDGLNYCGISLSSTPGHQNDASGIYCGECGDFVSSIKTDTCQYPTTSSYCFDNSIYIDYCTFDMPCNYSNICEAGGFYSANQTGMLCTAVPFLNQQCYSCFETCATQVEQSDSRKSSYLVTSSKTVTTLPMDAYGPKYFSTLSKCASMATPTITVTSDYDATNRSGSGIYNLNIKMTGRGAYGAGVETGGDDYMIRLENTLTLQDVTMTLNSESISLTNPRFCGAKISIRGTTNINGTPLAYNYCTQRYDVSYLDVETGANAYIKRLYLYITKAQVKADAILNVDTFQMHGSDVNLGMQVYGKLYAKSVVWTNGGVKIYSTGKFQADSWKADSTYKGTIYFEKGAQIKLGSVCKKMSAAGNITISADYTSLPSSFSGTSCDSTF